MVGAILKMKTNDLRLTEKLNEDNYKAKWLKW